MKDIHLNPKEEEIMRILWKLQKAFVKEIVAEIPEPRPPYTSVSTIVRKLQERGVVGYDAFGKTHRYYPVLTEEIYKNQSFSKLFTDYFKGSYKNMVSHFIKQHDADIDELEQILEEMKKKHSK